MITIFFNQPMITLDKQLEKNLGKSFLAATKKRIKAWRNFHLGFIGSTPSLTANSFMLATKLG